MCTSTGDEGQSLLCRLEAAAPKQHGESDAIACDPTRPEECLTYCYVMDDGSMVRIACDARPSERYCCMIMFAWTVGPCLADTRKTVNRWQRILFGCSPLVCPGPQQRKQLCLALR